MADQKMTTTQRAILVVVLVPTFMSLLSISSINVILPSIQDSLDATTSQIQWVLSGYTLAFGVLLVAAGRAGDTLAALVSLWPGWPSSGSARYCPGWPSTG